MVIRYDGSMVANLLNKQKSTRPIARKIIRLRDLASISEDLGHSSAAIDELADTFPIDYDGKSSLPLDQKISVLHGALAQRAIILYARATDTNSDDRGKFDVNKYYDAGQKNGHKQILIVRNSAIAHYGAGKHDGRPWSSDSIYFDFEPNISALWIRPNPVQYNFRGDILKILTNLLPIARMAVLEEYDKAEASLYADIQAHKFEFDEAVRQCGPIPIVERETANFTPVPFIS